MSRNPKAQIIPFPLPPYLASYFANKITTSPQITMDGSYAKPFRIKRDSPYGAFLLRSFSKIDRPLYSKDGFTFYISVNDHQTAQDKRVVNSKYSFIGLDENSVKEVTKVFKAIFEEALFNYVIGAEEVTNKFVERKRGIKMKAILNFCEKYKVTYTNQNLQAWVKAIYREKKRINVNKTSVL